MDGPIGQETAQVVRERLGRRVALLRVLRQALQHERLQIARDPRVELARRPRRLVLHPVDQPALVRIVERRPECQQLVERQAQAIDVALRQGLALEPFRSHEADRADDVAGVRQLLRPFGLGQPEVGDPHRPLQIEQQVRRLDVAVQDTLAVGVGQRVGGLDADPRHASVVLRLGPARRQPRAQRGRIGVVVRLAGIGGRGRVELACQKAVRHAPLGGQRLTGSQRPAEAADVGQHLVEPLALDELHGVVVDAVALADAEDGHDVGVMQPPGRLGLAAEAGKVRRVQQRRGRQHLEGHVPAERFLLRLVNDAHAAPAHLTQDAIVAEAIQFGEGGGRRPLETLGGVDGVGGWLQFLDLHRAGNRSRMSAARSG